MSKYLRLSIPWPGAESSVVQIRDENEHIQRHWFVGAYYEGNSKGMLRHIWRNCKQGLVYVDVGASIGNHTLFFANVMEAARVVAIEPVEESLDHLRANLERNPEIAERVEVIASAVSDHNGTVGMERYHPSNNAGMWRVTEGDDTPCATLDELLKDEQRVDILKIDVEHHNAEVLAGMVGTLETFKPTVYLEAEQDHELAAADEFFRLVGYARVRGVQLNYTPTYVWEKT
jgi:FkbM family methyltransferase